MAGWVVRAAHKHREGEARRGRLHELMAVEDTVRGAGDGVSLLRGTCCWLRSDIGRRPTWSATKGGPRGDGVETGEARVAARQPVAGWQLARCVVQLVLRPEFRRER